LDKYAIIALGFYACDKVSNPYISKGSGVVSIPVVPPTRVYSTSATVEDDSLKKILVEITQGIPVQIVLPLLLNVSAVKPGYGNHAIISATKCVPISVPKPHSAGYRNSLCN